MLAITQHTLILPCCIHVQYEKVFISLFSQEALRSYALVFDAVYTPKITRLLREAEESGAKIVTGVEMFIGQAYDQFERFTGLPGTTSLKHSRVQIFIEENDLIKNHKNDVVVAFW